MREEIAEKIVILERFKADIEAHFNGDQSDGVRSRINRAMPRVKRILAEAGALKAITLSPPPAIGGLMVRNADPFGFILRDYYGMSTIPMVADMIEEGIGILESPEYEERAASGSEGDGPPSLRQSEEAELPSKVTLAWLVQNVPVSFWLWLVGLLAAAFVAGVRFGPLMPDF